ncbi:MAG: hypothetical protein MJZ37_11015 [Bacilli bacterium]|nr:hypothetical protein [Bacilli bacterium]
MYRKTLSALIGLVGAESNNGKTEDTDAIVRQALLRMHEEDWSQRIREEKFRIAPNCATCSAPCGNTSDYPMEKFESWSADQRAIREQVIGELQRIAAAESDSLPEIVYRAIAYIGYDLEEDAYQRLLEDMKKW